MKHMMFVLIALLVVSAFAFGQKQPVPNFTGGTSVVNQAKHSGMLYGPHDFTPDSGKYVSERILDSTGAQIDSVWHPYGPSKNLCRYCHAAHVPVTGIAQPLWIRASSTTRTYAINKYKNPNSLDVTVDPVNNNDNYSSFCVSCHDGSVIFAASAYTEGSRPRASTGYRWGGDTVSTQFPWNSATVPNAANVINGEFNLEHVHPVNFVYADAVAADPQGLYPALSTTYVWSGTGTGSPAQTTSVRLFDGRMQCSSCHNPHMSSGIGTVLSSDYGKLCIACHKK